jgi:hypothetical protein
MITGNEAVVMVLVMWMCGFVSGYLIRDILDQRSRRIQR